MSAQAKKQEPRQKKSQTPIDTFREKRGRGRMPKLPLSEVQTRGYHYGQMLTSIWDHIEKPLLAAKSIEDVKAAFGGEGYSQEQQQFVPLAPLILQVLREKRFPKKRKARIKFLAESIAGLGRMSARRSRDVCSLERTQTRRTHQIVSYSFRIECSCGYKGFSKNLACAKCGALIPLERDLGLLEIL
jgi:hypothetical protein